MDTESSTSIEAPQQQQQQQQQQQRQSIDETKKMKLRLGGIPSILGSAQVRKFVAKTLAIPQECIVCRKAPQWNYAYLSFRPATGGNATQPPSLEGIKERLDGMPWKKTTLSATLEDSSRMDPLVARSQSKPNQTPIAERTLDDQVTPLWKIPYEQQLTRKQSHLESILKKKAHICNDSFHMDPIIPSPITLGYRNKCEFTIGNDKEGNPTVGFLLGGYREGIVTVANADNVLHIPESMKAVARHVQEFVRASGLPIYNRTTKEGLWRLVLVRVHNDTLMVAIQLNGASPDSVLLNQLVDHMKAFNNGSQFPITSFWIQSTMAVHHGIDTKTPFVLQFGTQTVAQTLRGLQFSISPLSFFQVNIPATELLYSQIAEYVTQGEIKTMDTILLDLCCGTGTIAMSLANQVERVIGIEITPEAVIDARQNALANNIQNVEFIADRVENAIEQLLARLPNDKKIVVVLDPPRSGVHKSVIKALRRVECISRLIYVACNAEAAVDNFLDLARQSSKNFPGTSFALTKARPVDLFPHTDHCELVLLFERTNPPSPSS